MSLGHASIVAAATAAQVNIHPKSWSISSPDFKCEEIVDFIMSNLHAPADVALGVFVWNEPFVKRILSSLTTFNFRGRIILGGPQISYVKKGLENYYPEADVFIRGYAEKPLVDLLLSSESKPAIKGVHYAGDPDQSTSATADLEDLPSPTSQALSLQIALFAGRPNVAVNSGVLFANTVSLPGL